MPVPAPSPEYLKFLSAYGPAITELSLAVREFVLTEAPEAVELIYDAYNAVSAGYSFTGRPSDGFIHIASYAHWVNLGFHKGSLLDDPHHILKGDSKWVRHIRITNAADLKPAHLRNFVRAAMANAVRPERKVSSGQSVVRAIYAKKRRPAQAKKRFV